MKITNKAVAEALDGLPPIKMHCSVLAEQAIKSALLDYSTKNNIHIEGLDEADLEDHGHGDLEEL
jgi:nitrogen fixation NifU-like protein